MHETVTLTLDGETVTVPAGITVAAALVNRPVHRPVIRGVDRTLERTLERNADRARLAIRTSVTGAPRGPLCGMGICFECRATIDGRVHVRTCMTLCRDGMEVVSGA